jgi:hypothetical protein
LPLAARFRAQSLARRRREGVAYEDRSGTFLSRLLLALPLALGLMAKLWVRAIACFVLLERLLPEGERVARIGGLAILAFGIHLPAPAIG